MTDGPLPHVGVEQDSDGFWRVTYDARVHHEVYVGPVYLDRADALTKAREIARATGGTIVVNTRDVATATA